VVVPVTKQAGRGREPRYERRETIALAFIAGLQRLPPLERAVFLLRDVAGFRSSEVAEMLGCSPGSVNSLLGHARTRFESFPPSPRGAAAPLPGSRLERQLLRAFADALEAGNIDGVLALVAEDAQLTVAPDPNPAQGTGVIEAFLRRAVGSGGLRLVTLRANGQPAVACYRESAATGIARSDAMVVLTLNDSRISALAWFADTRIFSRFGLPPTLIRSS
jgi:ketosteroid isomerase-like protein